MFSLYVIFLIVHLFCVHAFGDFQHAGLNLQRSSLGVYSGNEHTAHPIHFDALSILRNNHAHDAQRISAQQAVVEADRLAALALSHHIIYERALAETLRMQIDLYNHVHEIGRYPLGPRGEQTNLHQRYLVIDFHDTRRAMMPYAIEAAEQKKALLSTMVELQGHIELLHRYESRGARIVGAHRVVSDFHRVIRKIQLQTLPSVAMQRIANVMSTARALGFPLEEPSVDRVYTSHYWTEWYVRLNLEEAGHGGWMHTLVAVPGQGLEYGWRPRRTLHPLGSLEILHGS